MLFRRCCSHRNVKRNHFLSHKTSCDFYKISTWSHYFFGYLSLLHYFFYTFVLFHLGHAEDINHITMVVLLQFLLFILQKFFFLFFICKLWQFRNDYIIVSIVSFWLLIALANRKKTQFEQNFSRSRFSAKNCGSHFYWYFEILPMLIWSWMECECESELEFFFVLISLTGTAFHYQMKCQKQRK